MASLKRRILELESLLTDQEEEERFRAVVESAPNGIVVADSEGQIVMVNRRAEEIFGYGREEFLAVEIEDLVPDRFRGAHGARRKGYHHKPEPRGMGVGRDLYARRKDGTEFPVEIALTPLPRPEGVWVLSSVIDITERKFAEAKINFQAEILANIRDAVLYVDDEYRIRNWNEGAVRMFGVRPDEAIGRAIDEVCHSKSGRFISKTMTEVVGEHGFGVEVIQCLPPSGDDIFVRARFTSMDLDGSKGMVICASDITRETLLEAEIVRASENEQRRIGQDLHDDLCSQLSGIGCLTKVLETQVSGDSPDQSELASKISKMVAQAGTRAREIAKGLVPTVLETQGLAGAIRVLTERNRDVFGVPCRFALDDQGGLDQLSQEKAVQLYRIVQEAVNNAMKHSDADEVVVALKAQSESVELTIEDDGKGMRTDLATSGMGMMTMQRRAKLIGAELEVIASPGSGTRVSCELTQSEND